MTRAELIQYITDNVYPNARNEVTAPMVRDSLLEIVDFLGDAATYNIGMVATGNQGLVTGGNVKTAIALALLPYYTSDETDIAIDAAIQAIGLGQAAYKDLGQVASGDTGLVTGGQVYSAIDTAISAAIKFRGVSDTPLTDGSTTNPIMINGQSFTAQMGDMVVYGGDEYLWVGSKWQQMGDESSYALKTITVTGTGYLTGGGNLTQNRTIDISSTVKTYIDHGETTYNYFTNGVLDTEHLPSMYIGTTSVQFSAAAQNLTGISSVRATNDISTLFEWDSTNSAWHFHGSIYADGFFSGGGLSPGGGGGGGGIDPLAMWQILTNNPSLAQYDNYTKIAADHITFPVTSVVGLTGAVSAAQIAAALELGSLAYQSALYIGTTAVQSTSQQQDLTGIGAITSTSANVVAIKRTATGAANLMFYPDNQETHGWRIGTYGSADNYLFRIGYDGVDKVNITTAGGVLLNSGSLTMAAGYDINLSGSGALVKNVSYSGTMGWFRNIVTLRVDNNEKFNIGAVGNYTAGASDNTFNYVYIGPQGYSGTNLRIYSNGSLKWGNDDILHAGNYSTYALPLAGGTMTGGVTCSTSGANFVWGNITIYGGGANNSVNSMLIGDDALLGDCNVDGSFGIKAQNGNNAGVRFFTNTGTAIGGIQSTEGTLQWYDTGGSFRDIYHAGNSNKSDVAWTCSNLEASGTVHATVGLWSEGYFSGGGLASSSDARLKKAIRHFTYTQSLLMALKPREWEWNDKAVMKGHAAGFVAQEIESLFPYMVFDKGEYKALFYDQFHAIEISALQDHERRITELERENRELRKMLNMN